MMMVYTGADAAHGSEPHALGQLPAVRATEKQRGEFAMAVKDVAAYILERKGRMSAWKLQKLCYYAQAWTLAWDNVPLFDEEFEAWANGPVCPALFSLHRGAYMVTPEMIGGQSNQLTDEQKENINIVLDAYGDKEAYWLREQTHSEQPWQQARGDYPPGAICREVISKDSMGEYYGSL